MVLNQNSSADRLGLNPEELAMWVEHFARGCFILLEQRSYGLDCPTRKTLIEYLENQEL